MKKELNKWQIFIKWGELFYARNMRDFQFAILKITSFPQEGEMLTKKNYKGFWLNKSWNIKPNIIFSKVLF